VLRESEVQENFCKVSPSMKTGGEIAVRYSLRESSTMDSIWREGLPKSGGTPVTIRLTKVPQIHP
jgi:hypothetical protein